VGDTLLCVVLDNSVSSGGIRYCLWFWITVCLVADIIVDGFR